MEPFDTGNPHVMMILKITDFDEIKIHDHTTTMSFVGTCAYMAPEVLRAQRFSKASDIWRLVKSDLIHVFQSDLSILLICYFYMYNVHINSADFFLLWAFVQDSFCLCAL